MSFTGLPDRIPQCGAKSGAVEINLKPALAGIARARNQLRRALKIKPAVFEKPDIANTVAKQLYQQVLCFWSLHR